MKSILNISLSKESPVISTAVPIALGQKGLPFCFPSLSTVTSWHLVSCNNDYGYLLDNLYINADGAFIYYNGDVNLFDYLSGLGYDMGAGNYYFKILAGGNTKYSQTFYIDEETATPEYQGDYSTGDYSSTDYD